MPEVQKVHQVGEWSALLCWAGHHNHISCLQIAVGCTDMVPMSLHVGGLCDAVTHIHVDTLRGEGELCDAFFQHLEEFNLLSFLGQIYTAAPLKILYLLHRNVHFCKVGQNNASEKHIHTHFSADSFFKVKICTTSFFDSIKEADKASDGLCV